MAVIEVADYLKLNAENRNLFRNPGYRRRVKQMAAYIASGNKNLHNVLMERSPVEVAAGLQYYLIRLPGNLIPKYIQDLALDADGNMPPEVVAADMLGLIQQDLRGRHKLLVTVLLDMLSFSRKHAINDELAGSGVPITLLPVFFNILPDHLHKWRLIANIFMEMIELSPSILPLSDYFTNSSLGSTSERHFQQRNLLVNDDEIEEPGQIFEAQENVILHQVLTRNGNQGDGNFAEIVNINILRREIYPKMLNPTFGYYVRRFR